MALFKILSNMTDNSKSLPASYHQGYCYFDVNTGKFWIDTSDQEEGRMAINAANADTANSAASVPWSGVGGKPATATRWPTWNEVTNKPTIPVVNDGALHLQNNGVDVQTFTANSSQTAYFNLVPGDNISLTTDGSKITIAATSSTYSAGTGISFSGTTINNSGVRSISESSENGKLSVNTNGTTTQVPIHGLGTNAYTSTAYLPLSGGTMTGTFTAKSNQSTDNYTGAVNMNNSNIYGLNAIYTGDVSDGAAKGINFYRDATHVDTLWMNSGDLLFVPNRAIGTNTTKADSQKIGRFTVNPTDGQVVITDGTTGGIKSSGYTIAKSVPSDAKFTDTTYTFSNKSATLAWDTTTTIATVGGTNITVKMPVNPNSDTKNTAGSTDTSSKIFLIGATSQAANPQTYSQDTAYVGTDGALYSNSTKVKTVQTAVTAPSAATNKWVNTLAQDTNGAITPTYTTLDTSGTWSGNAGSATRLTTSAGSASTPVFFENGVPVAVTLDKLRDDMGITNPITFWGVTSDTLTTGSTQQSLTGLSGTAVNGYVVIDSSGTQFIWGVVNDVAQWNQIGSGLAYKVIQAESVDSGATAINQWVSRLQQDRNGNITTSTATLDTTGAWAGNAGSATKLQTARKLKVALGSTTDITFDGNSDQTSIPISGTLAVGHGGTGATTFASGTALIGNGTGAIGTRSITNNTSATAVAANTNLITANTLYYHKGNSNLDTVGTLTSGTWNASTIAIDYGGTGATTAAGARGTLGTAARINGVFYGTCDTAQATQAKVVTLVNGEGFALATGALVAVKFTNASAGATMTLKVGDTAAKNLCLYGGTAMSSGTTTSGWRAGAVVLFVYDGTQWERTFWENSTYYTESCYVSTAAGTAAKAGSLSNYALQKGYLQVLIMNANTAQSAITLNINSTGAKPIYINGSASSSSNYTLPKAMYLVYYDGTNFYFRTDGALTGGTFTGNAATATKFASSQSVALTGDVTGSASSQAGWSIATTLKNSGVTAGSYGPSANASPTHSGTFSVPYLTVDAKGRVTAASTKTITLPAGSSNTATTITIAAADWNATTLQCTKSVTGVTASNNIIVSPHPDNIFEYSQYQVYASAQAANSLTFKCSVKPTMALKVNLLIMS